MFVRRYQQSAIRAVNQALGRVIRHRHDYGAVILADERFHDKNIQMELSRWLRGYVGHYDAFGKASQRCPRAAQDNSSFSAAD